MRMMQMPLIFFALLLAAPSRPRAQHGADATADERDRISAERDRQAASSLADSMSDYARRNPTSGPSFGWGDDRTPGRVGECREGFAEPVLADGCRHM